MTESRPDYYNILGVPKETDIKSIKRAYRKLAKQWHPDRVQEAHKEEAEKKFKIINEAYAVLSDPEKRRQYDNPAPDFSFGRSPFFDDNFDPFSVFRDFFGDDHFFGGSPVGASRSSGSRRRNSGRGRMDPFRNNFFSGGLFDRDFGSMGSMGSSMSFSSSNFGRGRGSFKSVSKSTQIVNGRRRTIQTTSDNTGTTKEVFENGVLLEKWENDIKVFDLAIEGGHPDTPAIQRRSSGSRSSRRRHH